MAPSAVLERIRKLEKQGIIDGYEVRLNPEKFHRRRVAFIRVATHRHSIDHEVGKALAALCEVQEVHFISGDDGYLIKVRVADAEALGRLITEKNPGHRWRGLKPAPRWVLSTLKETAKIPIDTPMSS